MTDLSYSYIHMTADTIRSFDFLPTTESLVPLPTVEHDSVDIPEDHIPPDPDDADCLPSQVHPSYPYGNPTKPLHPSSMHTAPFGRGYKALYDLLSYDATKPPSRPGGPLRWADLATDRLLPVDPEVVEANKAAKARRTANGTGTGNGNGGGAGGGQAQGQAPNQAQPVAPEGGGDEEGVDLGDEYEDEDEDEDEEAVELGEDEDEDEDSEYEGDHLNGAGLPQDWDNVRARMDMR